MNVLLFRFKGEKLASAKEERDEELGTRSIRLPNYVWDALDKDAARCRRSPVRQLEAILIVLYQLDPHVEIDETALDKTAAIVTPQLRRVKSR